MKKTKILTVLSVLLAMGITACNGGGKSSDAPKSEEPPVSQSESPKPSSSESPKPSSEDPKPSSSEAPKPEKDQTGHIWGADADVAGDAENGLVAYKRAVCTEEDGFIKLAVNQSVVTYEKGGRKSGTPEGYTKLNSNGDIMSFKFNVDKYFKGKMYLFGCMDGWGSNSGKNAFSYNGNPNIEVKVNDEALDIAALKDVVYTDFLSGSASDYSDDGYGFIGDILLVPGVNYVSYKRVASMNTLVKDFVFVGQEFDSEWGEGQQVAAAEGSIAYVKYQSNVDERVKIEWKALDGTYAEGSSTKDGTPEGYLKLNSNGMSISYNLKLDANLDGQIYQRGAMDGYPGNANCTYFSQTKGAKYGNFEVKVNDSKVYIGDKREVKYGDMLGTSAAEGAAAIGNGYSEVKDCLIGNCFLKNGANTASFERVDSYNLAISHFVFIGKPGQAHVNPAADAEFSGKDADSHWQVTEGDNFQFNRAEHQWVADEANPDTASSCTEHGHKYYKCSICGATKSEELELLPHTWVSDPDLAATDVPSTCSTHGVAHVKCSVCGAKEAQELPFGEHTWGEAQTAIGDAIPHECSACHAMCYELAVASPAKLKSDLTWNVTGLPAGKYEVHLKACAAATTLTQNIVSGGSGRYQFRFGTEGDYVSPASGTYASYGLGTGEKLENVQWTNSLCELTAADGTAAFTIHYGGQGYSAFIAAVRLVKIA